MDEPFLCGGGEMGVGLGICSILLSREGPGVCVGEMESCVMSDIFCFLSG
jgi:hypothetical protein